MSDYGIIEEDDEQVIVEYTEHLIPIKSIPLRKDSDDEEAADGDPSELGTPK